jgi:branched-chain amino acid transport system ATP-binding protein
MRTCVPQLELCDVHAGYGGIEVLHGVSLEAVAGEVVAVLGPNGAGKTTMLRVASGVLEPSAGELVVAGRDVTGFDAGDLARAGVCTVPEGRAVFPNLTVEENLLMATYSGLERSTVEDIAFGHFPELAPRRKQLAGSLSGGEQQMLALARVVSTRPAVLLVDELSMGLAPIIASKLFELIPAIAAEGVAVVIVEQFAEAALSIASRVAVLVGGRLALAGDPASVRSHLQDAYLGATA